MWDNTYFSKWLEISKKDLDASAVLYEKKFYPQALYLLHQSIEKMTKGMLTSLKWIKSGKELGHNLKIAPAKVWEIEVDKLIDKAINELGESERKELDMDYKRFRKLFPQKYLTDMKHAATFRTLILRSKPSVSRLPMILNTLDKEIEYLTRFKIKVRNDIIKIEDKYKRKKNNRLIQLAFKKILEYARKETEYAIAVIYRLGEVLPDHELFRYPEFQPIKIYSNNHILVKHFRRIVKHAENAFQSFERIDYTFSLMKKQ